MYDYSFHIMGRLELSVPAPLAHTEWAELGGTLTVSIISKVLLLTRVSQLFFATSHIQMCHSPTTFDALVVLSTLSLALRCYEQAHKVKGAKKWIVWRWKLTWKVSRI